MNNYYNFYAYSYPYKNKEVPESVNIENSLTLYRTYYKDEQLKSCVSDKKYIIPINTNDAKYPLSSQLNQYWSEFALMKEIWKQGKKTDYICFDLYSKKFKSIKLNRNTDIYFYNKEIVDKNIYSHYKRWHPINEIDDVINILNAKYGINNKYVHYLMNSNILYSLSCFICKWELFSDMCSFIFGILDELDAKYELKYDKNNYYNRYINIKNIDFNYLRRSFGYLAERLISAYIFVNIKKNNITLNYCKNLLKLLHYFNYYT